MNGNLLIAVLVSVVIAFCILSVGSYFYFEYKHPCLQYVNTGGMVCYEVVEGVTNCNPERQCIRRAK